MQWEYENSEIRDIKDCPIGSIGFVYMLTYEDYTKYIGKKHLWKKEWKPLKINGFRSDKPIIRTVIRNHKRVQQECVVRESDWKKYEGSSELTKGKKVIKKIILEFARSEHELTYLEAKELFSHDVLRNSEFLNHNIDGRYFKDKL